MAGGRGLGGAGLAAIGLSLTCFLLLALLGPSAVEPRLPGSGPPFSLTVHPSPHVVIGLMAGGILLGALGLGLCLYAVRCGWRCAPRSLLIAGLLATAVFALMPPVGSSDHLNYAGYGRMVVTGHDPYTTRAVDLPDDPVLSAVQDWRLAPSVYGPIVTLQETFASWIGGTSVRLTAFVLSVTNALAFALVGLLLYRCAGRADSRRLRSVLLWTLNPLMLFHLVSGAHNDTLGIAAAIGALAAFAPRMSRAASGRTEPGGTRFPSVGRTLLSGLLIGAGVAIKLPAALVGGGPAWVLFRDWWASRRRRGEAARDRGTLLRLAVLFGGAGIVALVAFALVGSHAFDQVSRASNSVARASAWHLLDALLGVNRQRWVIRLGSILLLVSLVWLLARAIPRDLEPVDPELEPVGPEFTSVGPALRVGGSALGMVAESRLIALALVLAWLFAAPYVLPWYDGLGWAVLAMSALRAWSRFEWLVLAHTTALSLAYLPARGPEFARLPGDLDWLLKTVRPMVIPWVLTAVLLALVWTCLRPRSR
ncbi:MAG: hypothetical protein JWN52_7524 [Actinomycetia bacterium]|nr:hypothetical protein [Actinomycetes bacterium]